MGIPPPTRRQGRGGRNKGNYVAPRPTGARGPDVYAEPLSRPGVLAGRSAADR